MPYASTRELPAAIKNSVKAEVGRRLMLNVINGMLERGKSEEQAFAAAWAALKRAGYRKEGDSWRKVDKALCAEPKMGFVVKKVDKDRRMVWGWASITTRGGEPVVDYHGDIIDTEEMHKAAIEYMRQSRQTKYNHMGRVRGDTVESLMFTKELQDALGIDLGFEGWFVGKYISDDDLWQKIKAGDVLEMSIGGTGEYEILDKNLEVEVEIEIETEEDEEEPEEEGEEDEDE